MNQDQLIALLAQSPGYVSGQEMSQALGVTRGAIWKELSQRLLGELDMGVTLLHGQGAYTQREKQILMVAFKQKAIVRLKKTVHEVDPRAFLVVVNAHDVLGEGFGDYQKEEI